MILAVTHTNGQRLLCGLRNDALVPLTDATSELAGVTDVGALLGSPGAIASARNYLSHATRATLDSRDHSYAPPIAAPRKIICVGLNYRDHAAEGGMEPPPHPILFAKFDNTLIGAYDNIPHPTLTDSLDYEGELAVVIGRRASRVPVSEAASFIAGYCVANDVSARDLQHGDAGSQWLRGKSLDRFAPVGPYFVSADEVPDWRALRIRTWVNSELRQDASCGEMIFGVEELLSFISEGITLEAGDLILTGTPHGVGLGFDPPRWLVPGDVVEVEIDGLGRQRTLISDPAEASS